MITVACVWVQANVPYDVEYVERLAAMVRKHLKVPHRFVCLTDRPWLLPDGMDRMPIASPHPLPGWWAKVELFRPGRFTGRVLYLDLDTLVVDSLEPVVSWPAPFAVIPDGGSSFQPRNGRRVVKRFNSSVMVFDPDAGAPVWQACTPAAMAHLWGDQDLIGEVLPDASTFPLAWFPRLSTLTGPEMPDGARVVLSKKPKNHIAAQQWPWFDALWRAA